MLEIAAADYGYGKDENYKILKTVIRKKEFPTQLTGCFHEVLSLYRWSAAPLSNNQYAGRAFCCLILLNLPKDSNYECLSEDTTLTILISSVIVLGKKYHEPLLQFMFWQIQNTYEEEIICYKSQNWDLSEIDFEEPIDGSLLAVMLLNKRPENEIKIVFDSLGYTNANDKFISPTNSLIQSIKHDQELMFKAEIWVAIFAQILSSLNYITDKNLKKTFEHILNSFVDKIDLSIKF